MPPAGLFAQHHHHEHAGYRQGDDLLRHLELGAVPSGREADAIGGTAGQYSNSAMPS